MHRCSLLRLLQFYIVTVFHAYRFCALVPKTTGGCSNVVTAASWRHVVSIRPCDTHCRAHTDDHTAGSSLAIGRNSSVRCGLIITELVWGQRMFFMTSCVCTHRESLARTSSVGGTSCCHHHHTLCQSAVRLSTVGSCYVHEPCPGDDGSLLMVTGRRGSVVGSSESSLSE